VCNPDDGKSNEKINERSLARLSAILKDLKPGSETVRKVTLLEEACDCVLPWLSEVDLDLSRKLIKEVRRTLAQNYREVTNISRMIFVGWTLKTYFFLICYGDFIMTTFSVKFFQIWTSNWT
jgi:hypothetical protein